MVGPTAFKNLEQVCLTGPGGIERVRATAERIRGFMAQRASAAGN
jgi:hypothetical protein